MDVGTAYGMKPPAYRADLVEVGAGTPMGELMRRYWQPCFRSVDLSSDRPRRIRLLGEDLILFRDESGQAGLVAEHCCHRGASLFYGRIEDDGIRCCYHGWKFDGQGRCLDQPAEVDGGRNRAKIRQPWYPVQERYGLVYAYMGPPERKPVLPRWQSLEDLAEGEIIEIRTRPLGPKRQEDSRYDLDTVPYNWLAMYENAVDAAHLPWLHYHHTGDQFVEYEPVDAPVELPPYAVIKDFAASLIVERTTLGISQGFPLTGPGGVRMITSNEAIIPNIIAVPAFVDMVYVVPSDDTSYFVFALWKSKFDGEHGAAEELHNGKTWWEMTQQEHQRFPGDYEAMSSIGPVPRHNMEHLAQSDRALSMLRRRLEEAVREVAEGRDAPNLSFDENAPPIEIRGHKAVAQQVAAE